MSLGEGYFALLGASIALSAALLVVLWRDHSLGRPLRAELAAVALAGALYNMLSGPLAAEIGRDLMPAARALAASAVIWLWSAAGRLFDRHARPPLPVAGQWVVIVAGLWMPGVAAVAWAAARPLANAAIALIAFAATLHLVVLLVAGRHDDLDEHRRRMRLMLAGGGSLYVGAVLLAYFLGGLQGHPLAAALVLCTVQVLFKLAWLALSVGQPSALSRVAAIGSMPETIPDQPLPAPTDALAARQAAHILAAMEVERLYRRTGLSIGDLAAHLGLPEHRVRAVINGHLGFRNYSAFLNHFRLPEVARRLRDPAEAHLPILSIALDSGYASIGPFNRAFREAFGQTPGDFRRGASPDAPTEKSTNSAEFETGA